MKPILLFSLVALSTCVIKDAYSQNDCHWFVKETNRFLRGKEKKSKEPLIFQLSKNLYGELQFSNLGLARTIQMTLSFKDTLGLSEETGELLTIDFKDGSVQQLIPGSNDVTSGVASFMLVKSKNKNVKIMTEEDLAFFEKLRDINVVSFRLQVSNLPHVIMVSKEQGDKIRGIVGCLIE